MLLLHGLMSRATAWWPVAQWLTPFGRVVGIDQRGHGRNPQRGPFRTEDWLLLRQHSPVLAHGRSFGRGDVLTEDGVLVASYGQEALVRFTEQQ